MFVSGRATILHADLDAFYASVEQRDDPRLRGRPVIVGGGVVLAASYEAKAFGVRTAMGGAQARRLCPRAIVVPPRMSAYCEASKAVFEVFEQTTPLVEALSIDEAFLDVRGLERISGTPTEIAARLRARGPRAGRPADHGRGGANQVPRQGGERRRQAGRAARGASPAASSPSCTRSQSSGCGASGAVTAAKLHGRGVTTVGEVARLDEVALVAIARSGVGSPSARPRRTTAIPRPVQLASPPALDRGPARARPAPRPVDGARRGARRILVDRVTRRMRAARRVGRTVVLRLRFADFSRATRSSTLPEPTAHTDAILGTARPGCCGSRCR